MLIKCEHCVRYAERVDGSRGERILEDPMTLAVMRMTPEGLGLHTRVGWVALRVSSSHYWHRSSRRCACLTVGVNISG